MFDRSYGDGSAETFGRKKQDKENKNSTKKS